MHVVVLSPHRDDAAFSCGLFLIALLRADSTITIVNVFTVSDYAPYLAEIGSDRIAQVTLERAHEDFRFCEEIIQHATVDRERVCLIDLGLQDAPLRRSMPTEQVLTTEPGDKEIEQLATLLANLPAAGIVLVPLALGGHVDHRLVRDVAVHIYPSDVLVFYEDLPYVAWMTPDQRDAEICSLLPFPCRRWFAAETSSNLKRQLAMCYPSQIGPEIADSMQRYATQNDCSESFYAADVLLKRLTELVPTQSKKL